MLNKIKDNIWQLYFNQFGSCVYLIKLNNKNVLIDTSTLENKEELIGNLKELDVKLPKVDMVLLTHNHWDHIQNISLFANAKIYSYDNIEKFPVKEIKVIKTPGHTQDSLSFLYDKFLFSGDTLFNNGIGRTDFPNSSLKDMKESLEKLKKIDYKILCPGHEN